MAESGATRVGEHAGGGNRGVALIRTPFTLPKILSPVEVDALIAALRGHWRDRAMVEAMLLGGLRRCEVLGLRFEDLRPGEGRVFVAEGKGGHQRLVPMSARFFPLRRCLHRHRTTRRGDDGLRCSSGVEGTTPWPASHHGRAGRDRGLGPHVAGPG